MREKISNKTSQDKNKLNKLKQQKTKTANNAEYYEGDSSYQKEGKDKSVKR